MNALRVSHLLVGVPLLAGVTTLALRRWQGPATLVSVVAAP